jgi:hypothetical protein
MKKRGQQMTLGTIIAIVLGIAVLVFLIFGFSTGFGNLMQQVGIIGQTESNVDDIAKGCNLACQKGDQYEYCTLERTVELGGDEGKTIEGKTCNELSEDGNVSGAINGCPTISCATN